MLEVELVDVNRRTECLQKRPPSGIYTRADGEGNKVIFESVLKATNQRPEKARTKFLYNDKYCNMIHVLWNIIVQLA